MTASAPARSDGAVSGSTVRNTPWKPAPNPTPATTVPMNSTAGDIQTIASTTLATPTNSATAPSSATVRGCRLRVRNTVTPPLAARVNSDSPPSTNEVEPDTSRTRAGPSDP